MKSSKKISSPKKFSKKQHNSHFGNNHNSIFPNGKEPDLKSLKTSYPSNANQQLELNLGKTKANRFILYYGSTKKEFDNYNSVKKSKNAYDDFRNHGIAKTNTNGNVLLKFRCPQVYKEEGNTVFPHIHYIIADKGNKKWIKKLMVEHVICNVSHSELEDIIKKGCALILNALPIEYYIKDRIPMSAPLPHDLVLDKLKPKEVIEYIKTMMAHAPVVSKAVKSSKMDIMDIPIVTYCYDSNCGADDDLQQKLNKIGFKNVKVYKLGIIGFNKRSK